MKNFTLSFEAIGTKWVIDCFNSSKSENEILDVLNKRIEEFDKTYSRFRDDSLVSKIAKKAGTYTFPPDSKDLFSLYNSLYWISKGKFTLLIGNTLDEAGYDANYSLIPKKLNKVPEASFIFEWNYPILNVKKPYILDFGGLGKGYLIDIISEILKTEKVETFCIDGGGDISCYNLISPIRIGLENPKDLNQVIGIVEINNKAICASSGNRRRWDKFHHIMDPDSLSSPNAILASWVIAENAIIADAIATSLFLVNVNKLHKYFNFEYLILNPDFTIQKSPNFSAELFKK